MKVLLAGATGVLGGRLTTVLRTAGHEVIALSRSAERAQRLRDMGVQSVVADALDRDELLNAVDGLRADAVVHELAALSKAPSGIPVCELRTGCVAREPQTCWQRPTDLA
jgi:uncharacterized protein YbjT (DUF2867 family)